MIVCRLFALARAPARWMRSATALLSASTAAPLSRSLAFFTWSRTFDWITSISPIVPPVPRARSADPRGPDEPAVAEEIVPGPVELAERRARLLLVLGAADRDRGRDLLDLRDLRERRLGARRGNRGARDLDDRN